MFLIYLFAFIGFVTISFLIYYGFIHPSIERKREEKEEFNTNKKAEKIRIELVKRFKEASENHRMIFSFFGTDRALSETELFNRVSLSYGGPGNYYSQDCTHEELIQTEIDEYFENRLLKKCPWNNNLIIIGGILKKPSHPNGVYKYKWISWDEWLEENEKVAKPKSLRQIQFEKSEWGFEV